MRREGVVRAKRKGRRQDPSWPAAQKEPPYVTAPHRSQALPGAEL